MTFDLSKEENRVRQVQTMLRYLSFALDEPIYTVNVTGKYDKQTENAVRHFQAKNKLPVTGIVDLDTGTRSPHSMSEKTKGELPFCCTPSAHPQTMLRRRERLAMSF